MDAFPSYADGPNARNTHSFTFMIWYIMMKHGTTRPKLQKTCPLCYEISLISHYFTRKEHQILQEKWRQRKQRKRGVYVTSIKKPFIFKMQETSKVRVQNSFKLYCFEYFIKTLDWDPGNKMTMHWHENDIEHRQCCKYLK